MVSMGAVTVCNFVSRNSLIVSHGASGSEAKTRLSQFGLRNQTETHNGLKPFNKLDVLWKRTPATAICRSASRKIVCKHGLNMVFVGAEHAPLGKSAGVGDVLDGLPSAMAARGHRVMTITPHNDRSKDTWDNDVTAEIQVGDQISNVRLFHSSQQGVDQVFVDHSIFLEKVWGKPKSKFYWPKAGVDSEDNQLRFSLLCQTALLAPLALNLDNSKYFSGPYGEDVVFLTKNWHTTLLPCYLETMYQPRGVYKSAKAASRIHNVGHQGRFGFSDFSLQNLPDKFKSSFDFPDGHHKPLKGRKINRMKTEILESDRVLTATPYYAQELLPGNERGVELDAIIRPIAVSGILNGMDLPDWNPSIDRDIPTKFNAETDGEAKAGLKENLQAKVRLPVDRNIPLIGFIGRLEEQKGSDILAAAIQQFVHENVQLVVLGTGEKYLEQQIEELEMKYPDKARGVAKFDVPLAHLMNAAADFLIIPSRFCWE